MGGFVIAQAIPLLAAPFLTRFYAPEAFGLQALFMSLTAVATTLATFRLDLAMLLADEREERELLGTILLLLLGVLILMAPLLFWGGTWIEARWGARGATAWIWLLMPMAAASVFFVVSTAILTKLKRFGPLARANVANQATYAVAAGGLPVIAGAHGLVAAKLCGQFVGAAFVSPATAGYIWQRIHLPEANRLPHLWRRFRQFVIFNTPYSLVGAVSRDMPIYIFSALSANAAAGFYSLARMLLSVPNLVATASLSQVYYREALDLRGTPQFEAMTSRLLRLTLFASAPLFAFILVWGDVLFGTVFGQRWVDAGVFSMILAPAAWLSLQTGWPERLFEVAMKQDLSFKIQVGFDTVAACAVVLPMLSGLDPLWSVVGFAVVNSAYHVTYLTAIFVISDFSRTGLLETLLIGIGLLMASSLLLVLIRMASAPPIVLAVLSVAVSVTVAAGLGFRGVRDLLRLTGSVEKAK